MEGHTSMVYEIFLDKLVPDVFVVPIGGGGLISGVSIAAHEWFPSSVVIGVEPENAKDALLSVEKGEIVRLSNVQTIADGLKTSLGDLTFPVIRKHVERIVTVSEEEIKEAQIEIMSRLKIVTEPSSATVWAAIKKYTSLFKGKQIVAILSGGNIDFT
jgi:threonine dehydratase